MSNQNVWKSPTKIIANLSYCANNHWIKWLVISDKKMWCHSEKTSTLSLFRKITLARCHLCYINPGNTIYSLWKIFSFAFESICSLHFSGIFLICFKTVLAKSHACFSFIMSINLSRCYSEGLPRCCPSTFCHWQQNSEDPQVQGSGPWPARGSVPPHQEGCGGQEAPGEKQKGTAKLGQWPGTRSYSITWKISLFSM